MVRNFILAWWNETWLIMMNDFTRSAIFYANSSYKLNYSHDGSKFNTEIVTRYICPDTKFDPRTTYLFNIATSWIAIWKCLLTRLHHARPFFPSQRFPDRWLYNHTVAILCVLGMAWWLWHVTWSYGNMKSKLWRTNGQNMDPNMPWKSK